MVESTLVFTFWRPHEARRCRDEEGDDGDEEMKTKGVLPKTEVGILLQRVDGAPERVFSSQVDPFITPCLVYPVRLSLCTQPDFGRSCGPAISCSIGGDGEPLGPGIGRGSGGCTAW